MYITNTVFWGLERIKPYSLIILPSLESNEILLILSIWEGRGKQGELFI